MSFTATINSQGNFTASVNGSAVFNVSAPESAPMNVGMAVIGPTGLLTADAPLIYDGVLKNISIDLSDYASLAYVNSTFYPLSNPAGYITTADLSGYATESWVTGQGYITSAALAPYLLSSTAAATYQPIGDYATNSALTSGLALKLDKPAVAGLADQILSTDGVNNIWIDNQARTLFSTVRNETGAPLTKGTIVYISGAAGNKPLVSKAIATGDPTSAGTFAILSTDIPNNQNGTAIIAGELKGVNTFGIPEGTNLWLSPTTAGTWTTTKPNAPDHIVFIGTVVREHQNQGVIEVRIQNGFELDELHDVAILDRANKDILWYDGATSLWKSNTIAEVLGYTPANSSDLSNYYLASNPAGYITTSALAGYATESWVTAGFAPSGWNPFNQSLNTTDYANFSGVQTSDGSTGVAVTPLGITTLEFGMGYPVRTQVNNGGVQLGTGGVITFSDGTYQSTAVNLSGYATESWVQSQGYLTAPYNPFDQSLNTTDSPTFNQLYLNDGFGTTASFSQPNRLELTGYSGLDGGVYVNGSNIAFSLTNGTTTVQMDLGGITFPDGTTQSSAAVTPDLTPYAEKAVTNTFTASQVISVADNTNAALRVTQTGTGESFRVEDSTSPDSTPFVITNDGRVGIGRQPTAGYLLDVAGQAVVAAGNTSTLFTSGGTTITATSTAVGLTINNTGTGNSLVVNDESGDTTPFVINAAGNVGIGTSSPSFNLQVTGRSYLNNTSAAGGDAVLWVRQSSAGSSIVALQVSNQGVGASFRVDDEASDLTPFIVDAGGNVGVKTDSPAYDLDINGTANLTTLRFADGTTQNTAFKNDWTGSYQFQDGAFGSTSSYVYITGTGIQFPDSTVQTTAWTGSYNPFDQSLNTTDSPEFFWVSSASGVKRVRLDAQGVVGEYGLFIEDPDTGTYAKYTQAGITFADGTVQTTAASGNAFDQDLNTTDAVQFAGLTVSDVASPASSVVITPDGTITVNDDGGGLDGGLYLNGANVCISFNNTDYQYKAYPFYGAVAAAIEGGLLNANSPSATNAFATLGDVESSVNAYAASVLPVLPTTDQKAAMGNANSPSASNPFLTATALPVGSESQAGILELANESESLDYTNTTKPLATDKTLNFLRRFLLKRGWYTLQGGLSTQVSGTGTSYTQLATYVNITPPNATLAGFTRGYTIINSAKPTTIGAGFWSFSDPAAIGHTMYLNNASTRVGTRVMSTMGEVNSPTAGVVIGDPTAKRVGWSWYLGANLQLMVHNGTTLTFVDLGYAPPVDGFSRKHYIEYGWDGSGNAYLFVKTDTGAEYTCTTNLAPTGAYASATNATYMLQVSTNGTQTSNGWNLSSGHPTFYFP